VFLLFVGGVSGGVGVVGCGRWVFVGVLWVVGGGVCLGLWFIVFCFNLGLGARGFSAKNDTEGLEEGSPTLTLKERRTNSFPWVGRRQTERKKKGRTGTDGQRGRTNKKSC